METIKEVFERSREAYLIRYQLKDSANTVFLEQGKAEVPMADQGSVFVDVHELLKDYFLVVASPNSRDYVMCNAIPKDMDALEEYFRPLLEP